MHCLKLAQEDILIVQRKRGNILTRWMKCEEARGGVREYPLLPPPPHFFRRELPLLTFFLPLDGAALYDSDATPLTESQFIFDIWGLLLYLNIPFSYRVCINDNAVCFINTPIHTATHRLHADNSPNNICTPSG